jgi:hypothetical protein
MTATTIDADRVDAFSGSISGTVLQPGEDHYEAARRVHNGLIDKRPALIARCRGAADVSAAVGLGVRRVWRSRFAAADTTSPGGASPTAV